MVKTNLRLFEKVKKAEVRLLTPAVQCSCICSQLEDDDGMVYIRELEFADSDQFA